MSGLREPELTLARRKNTGAHIIDVVTSKSEIEESDASRTINKVSFSIGAREMLTKVSSMKWLKNMNNPSCRSRLVDLRYVFQNTIDIHRLIFL